jgi:hypothetical protein
MMLPSHDVQWVDEFADRLGDRIDAKFREMRRTLSAILIVYFVALTAMQLTLITTLMR